MAYHVTTLEVCAEGMERLRAQSEFILCAYAGSDSSPEAIADEWRQDIQTCARPDGFDYDGARAAIDSFMADGGRERLARELAAVPWDEWEPDGPDSDDCESIPCKLYIETESD